jgi:hypothetical protein
MTRIRYHAEDKAPSDDETICRTHPGPGVPVPSIGLVTNFLEYYAISSTRTRLHETKPTDQSIKSVFAGPIPHFPEEVRILDD